MASGTSKETEIKLTNVARVSLEELLIDYRDFLRVRGLCEWSKEHPYTKRLRELNKIPEANYDTFRKGIENPERLQKFVSFSSFWSFSSFLFKGNTQKMDITNFNKLDTTTQMAMIIAMHIRNEMEDCHSKCLSDEQMKELNPIIRQATYDILNCIRQASNIDNSNEKIAAKSIINFLVQSMPDYWEHPRKSNF